MPLPEPPEVSVYFYPRPPRGGRRVPGWHGKHRFARISIHALRAEGDPAIGHTPQCPEIFLSTPSVRRATWMK